MSQILVDFDLRLRWSVPQKTEGYLIRWWDKTLPLVLQKGNLFFSESHGDSNKIVKQVRSTFKVTVQWRPLILCSSITHTSDLSRFTRVKYRMMRGGTTYASLAAAASSLVRFLIYPFLGLRHFFCRLCQIQDHAEVSSLEDQVYG